MEKRVHKAGEIWTEPLTGMQFVYVPAGCYQMGCGSWTDHCASNEKPVHEVCIDAFWMAQYEVTIEQYREFLKARGDTGGADWDDEHCPIIKNELYTLSGHKYGQNGRQPMVEVSWHGAKAFTTWLSRRTGKSFRLPTEAEWEYAARSGGKREKYAGGNDVDRVAWYTGISGGKTHKVGGKAPNSLSIYDMSGNVEEWCADWYNAKAYTVHTRQNPRYEKHNSQESKRVVRGGSYYKDPPEDVRCSNRASFSPNETYSNLGFRVLRNE